MQATDGRPWRWLPSATGLVVVVAALAGARLGLKAISDNSELVHIRTGIQLVHNLHVPTRDPYSFTAPGHAWTVQSWLASLTYGIASSIGHHALVLEQGLLMAATGAVTALAARSTSAWRTGLAALLAIAASAPGWSPRPLMFELLCFALVLVIVGRGASPLWLIPVVWIWVNTHGSYPIGVAWLAVHAVGEAADVWGIPRRALRYLGGFVAGLAVSVLNPIGTRLLTFPYISVEKRAIFQTIVEWRSPNFQDGNSFIALVFIAISLVIIFRARLPWAEALPVGMLLAAGLVSERNLAPLGIGLAPALALALAQPVVAAPADIVADVSGLLDRIGRSVVWRAGVVVAAVLALCGLVAVTVRGPTYSLGSYPVKATDYLAATGRLDAPHRIAAIDVIGCYLIWRAGPQTKVFIDDRYDMYPDSVVRDASILANARGDAPGVLDAWRIDTVLWAANQALPGVLLQTGQWRETWSDADWVVLERDS